MIELLPKRFTDNVDFSGECWLWTGYTSVTGYGEISSNGKKVRTHRFAWECVHGKIHDGLHVLHKCDIRNCVNPDHLSLGTHQQNMLDRLERGRNFGQKGALNGNSKLTQKDADEIRKLYKRGKGGIKSEFSTIGLAKRYGVGSNAIGDIINNKRWVSTS